MALLRRHAFSLAFLVVLFGFIFVWNSEDADVIQLSGLTMGTSYRLQLADVPSSLNLDDIEVSVSSILHRMDKEIFSTYSEDSELSALNRYPVNQPFSASTDMINVLEMAQRVSELSGGAFDVTVGPLVNLWGFGSDYSANGAVPEQTLIDAAKQKVGYLNVSLNQRSAAVTKLVGVEIDLSAIAKGYAVDKLAEYFDDLGLESYFLEVGGELKMKGLKPSGASWVPAIEAPMDTESQIYEVFFSRGKQLAVAGSGDYRNYFEQDGVRYSHEIDPRNGYPVTHNLAAAYVIDESAAMADALATSYMILGFEQAKILAESQGQAAYFIYKEEGGFVDYATNAFDEYLEN